MDKRISYKIVLDTETAPMDKDLKGVSADNMLVYDCGWVVTDKRGNVYESRSFINSDIFFVEKSLMQSAYYSNKIPKYIEEIKSKKRILTNLYHIRKTLFEDCKKYGIKEIYAHNARFDYVSLNRTERWETKSKTRFFFPYDITICDTLKMSRDVLKNMPTYRKFCEDNNYITKNNQLRMTAEIIYRFISKDNSFCEEHTGLADVMIEKEILAYLFRQHKKMRKELFSKEG